MAMLPNDMVKAKCVLIVDDSQTMRDTLSALISSLDCQTFLANDGMEALNMLQQHHIDLVVTDLIMPNMTGLELLTEIRKTFSLAELPVILVSGNVDQATKQQALYYGACEVLTKPFETKQLLLVVLKQLTTVRGGPCFSNTLPVAQ